MLMISKEKFRFNKCPHNRNTPKVMVFGSNLSGKGYALSLSSLEKGNALAKHPRTISYFADISGYTCITTINHGVIGLFMDTHI